MRNKEITTIPGPAGMLETWVTLPKETPVAVAIICHPHPLQSGTMNHKVITILAKAYDLCSAVTIRFNFRGVEKSEGVFDHTHGECEDLRAIIQWVQKYYPKLPIWLAGFSFGSYVAARVAYDDKIADTLISIAPPVAKSDEYDFNAIQTIACPWLVVQGDHDEIVSCEATVAWWGNRVLAPHQELRIMADAGHFFHRRLIELRDIVYDWMISLRG